MVLVFILVTIVKVSVAQSCPTLCDPMDYSQAPLYMGFPRKEYWSRFPFPSPGDLSDRGIESSLCYPNYVTLSRSVMSDSLQPHGL